MSAPMSAHNARESDPALRRLDGEGWLARRLGRHGVLGVFDGATTSADRRERLRQAITSRGLEVIVCGKRGSKPITYAEAFEALYGEKP